MLFVCGDPRGLRTSRVLSIEPTEDPYSLRLDSGELIPLTMMVRRIRRVREGRLALLPCWRKLRTFSLTAGAITGETLATRLNATLRGIVDDVTAQVMAESVAQRRAASIAPPAPSRMPPAPSVVIMISDSESSDDNIVQPRPTTIAPTPGTAPGTWLHSDEGSDSSDEDFVRDRFHTGTRPGDLVRDFARDRVREGRPDHRAGNVWRDADPLWSSRVVRISENRNPNRVKFSNEDLGSSTVTGAPVGTRPRRRSVPMTTATLVHTVPIVFDRQSRWSLSTPSIKGFVFKLHT